MKKTLTEQRSFEEQVFIGAPLASVWQALTHVERMKEWMGEPEMQVTIETDWKIGSPFIVRGYHHISFKNTGVVQNFEPMSRLSYTHLSSLSRLLENPENYAIIDFRLAPANDATLLILSIASPPVGAIFEHLRFYWRGALQALKQHVERAISQ